ncbi:MAG: AAA family ATPase [Desulfobacteraceae bacterium]|nr:AAA family ATPase [Desulfobacteraceae bacterium]
MALYVFFGLIATGKSALARVWADRHGLAYFNSDVVRKELAGLAPTARRQEAVDKGIYTPDFSARTYDALLAKGEAEIRAGRGGVLDASYQKRAERERVRALARRLGFPVYFVLCVCPEPVVRERLARRAVDPAAVSDGRWEVYLRQKERFELPTELEPDELVTIETAGPVEGTVVRLSAALRKIEAG